MFFSMAQVAHAIERPGHCVIELIVHSALPQFDGTTIAFNTGPNPFRLTVMGLGGSLA
jgi:hypothetical protein